ncbi:MAG: 23S rRNA (adenine(2503)-C(2))-methyltransferase RlmN [Oscillospiraceae bacterium]|nr:23S rRNA (adenine(2503)-C(2))-methyltransferase RlmN [Oscillospiraceae bacterium]
MHHDPDKTDIKSLKFSAVEAFLEKEGEPKYRARQLFEWLHQKHAADFGIMTTLPAGLREQLLKQCFINSLKIKKKLVSAHDGTVKYLYELMDANCIESVLMGYHHGNSLCVSTQAGCRMGCGFCASTQAGLERNLSASEMLEQVYKTEQDSKKPVSGVVLMGIGEPLDNYENVLDFLEILSSKQGRGMSLRHVSLSTCGLVDKMDKLAEKRLPLTLSVSLHAPNDKIRSALMPVNNRWGVDELIDAAKRYFDKTSRRVSFEYALINGANDGDDNARELARLLFGMNCHVNLIPANDVTGSRHRGSRDKQVQRFHKILTDMNINTTVRRRLGDDVNAACGQLRLKTDS